MVENKNIVRIFFDISLSLSLCYNVHGQHVTPVLSLKQVIKLCNIDISNKFFVNYMYLMLEKFILLVYVTSSRRKSDSNLNVKN